MIEMGLMDGQEWPTPDHKVVAQNLALCNPQITNKDRLIEIVQSVIKIPKERIRLVTYEDCRQEFKVPV